MASGRRSESSLDRTANTSARTATVLSATTSTTFRTASSARRPQEMKTMAKKDIHVVPYPQGGWATGREVTDRVGSRQATQPEAADAARTRAQQDRVAVVIHRPDGQIRDSDSYGNDPKPPIDKKH